MLSVNFNHSVLTAQNNLASVTSSLSKSLERMSTGFRINAAKDDAAGMFISTNLNKHINGLTCAKDNVNNGISLINTASESLNSMTGLLNRIRDLAVQGASGVYDDLSRAAMQQEANSLTAELNQIKEAAVFNGKKLFESSEISVDPAPAGYTPIYTAEDLNNIRYNLNSSGYATGNYVLMNDIDLSGYSNWEPIRQAQNIQIYGNGHVIKNLTINRPTESQVGLFGYVDSGYFRSIGLENCNVTGGNNTGALVGQSYSASIIYSYVSGSVSGKINVGGMAGKHDMAYISDSYCEANVTGQERVGGILGNNGITYITKCYAIGKVTGNTNVGAIVGENYHGRIISTFWDTQKTTQTNGWGIDTNGGGTFTDSAGLTTAQMADSSHYLNAGWNAPGNIERWDFSSSPPKLAWQTYKPPTVVRLQVGYDSTDTSCITVDTSVDFQNFSADFSTAESCAAAINEIDGVLRTIGKKMSYFGALLNRLDSVLSSQTATIENLTAARSTITDTDIADEAALMVKNQILQQTTTALISQTQNADSSLILGLIK